MAAQIRQPPSELHHRACNLQIFLLFQGSLGMPLPLLFRFELDGSVAMAIADVFQKNKKNAISMENKFS